MTALNTSLNECIGYAVSASSTNRFPSGSISNTVITDRYPNIPSYWSSKGHADPDASETLIYILKTDLCVISEFNVQPFEAFFQPGKPIYSAKSVRLRKSACSSSSYQNLCFALVDICRLNCWVEFRDNIRTTCFTYALAM